MLFVGGRQNGHPGPGPHGRQHLEERLTSRSRRQAVGLRDAIGVSGRGQQCLHRVNLRQSGECFRADGPVWIRPGVDAGGEIEPPGRRRAEYPSGGGKVAAVPWMIGSWFHDWTLRYPNRAPSGSSGGPRHTVPPKSTLAVHASAWPACARAALMMPAWVTTAWDPPLRR